MGKLIGKKTIGKQRTTPYHPKVLPKIEPLSEESQPEKIDDGVKREDLIKFFQGAITSDNVSIKPKHERINTPDDMNISLLEHQKLGVEWMVGMERSNSKGGLLADDMGLGKTIQVLGLCCLNKPEMNEKNKSTLIIAVSFG